MSVKCRKKEMVKRGYITGMKFWMGWWEQDGERRFGIDSVQDVKRPRLLSSEQTEYLPPKPPMTTFRMNSVSISGN
jgi:hypothetical protein